jgi:hypothetical protein
MRRFDLIYIGIAITGRALATACEQGNKHPVVLFNIPANGQRQQDAQYIQPKQQQLYASH